MGLTNKFYCKHCKQIKSRFQVKGVDNYYNYFYECRYCHEPTERVEHMLVRLDKDMHKFQNKIEIHNMKDWVFNKANELYPNDEVSRTAFQTGVFTMLDEIGFEYDGKEV